MKLELDVDIRGALDKIDRARQDQIPFAVSVALNDVAWQVVNATPAILQAHLDAPTRFTTDTRGMYVERADKRKLLATVAFKSRQSAYLRYQIEGGERRPSRKALRLPTEIPLNEFGNLPARTIATLVARAQADKGLTKGQAKRLRVSNKTTIFYGDPGDGRPPGLYQRVPLPGSGGNRLIPLIVFPEQSAKYKRRLPWYDEVRRIAKREIGPAFERAMREAVRTARG